MVQLLDKNDLFLFALLLILESQFYSVSCLPCEYIHTPYNGFKYGVLDKTQRFKVNNNKSAFKPVSFAPHDYRIGHNLVCIRYLHMYFESDYVIP